LYCRYCPIIHLPLSLNAGMVCFAAMFSALRTFFSFAFAQSETDMIRY
jgi:hypothetical protein